MLISQKIAGFSKGESDNLCKALGKKKVAKIDEFHVKFLEGGAAGKYPAEALGKIWNEFLIFAPYAFNKSHAVSYTWISYCMGYLKTHHPHEF